MHVLVVEDDSLVADGIVAGLQLDHFSVDHVVSAAAAKAALQSFTSDIVVLDLGLPDADGLDLLNHWRQQGNRIPVLILTARDAIKDKVAGLNAGADDYLLKPFELDELSARLRALLRRTTGLSGPCLYHGNLRFNPQTRELWQNGDPVELTALETTLIERFLYAGKVILSQSQIRDSLYGFDASESNAINVHIHNLRRKLGRSVIITIRGMGYRLGSE